MDNKVIITAAVTGTITPSQSPYLPITPDEIAEEAYAACQEGASVIHIHARNPENGHPSPDIGIFSEIAEKIKKKCENVIICFTTGGGVGMTKEERTRIIPNLKPELASFNAGSMNFGLFPAGSRIENFKFDWEKNYLESTRDFVFKNTFADLEYVAKVFKENNTKPEIEVFDAGQLYNVHYLVRKGLVDLPVHLQFVTGVLGGIASRPSDLQYLVQTAKDLFDKSFTWSAIGVGYPAEFNIVALATILGGNVRVGLEDNLFIENGKLAKSNSELVAKTRRIINELGKEVTTIDETRKILGLVK